MKAKSKKGEKFVAFEKNAIGPDKKVEDIKWEGETVQAESTTKLSDDTGQGSPIVLRFFDFGANIKTFKDHKPTAQELFDSHIRGIESLLWRDGLRFFKDVEPRLIFSKDRTKYRFIIACEPNSTNVLAEAPKTLTQLLR